MKSEEYIKLINTILSKHTAALTAHQNALNDQNTTIQICTAMIKHLHQQVKTLTTAIEQLKKENDL